MSDTQFTRIENVDMLEDTMSRPTKGVVDTFRRLEGDILILGVGGKMGPTLARMAKRASDEAGVKRRIIGVDLFPSGDQDKKLQAAGIETIKCDLLDDCQFGNLPDAPNVIFMVGMKFGSTGNESLTWAMNSFLPGVVAQKYRNSRILVFSTGNIYGLTPVTAGGSLETDAPNPVGEYAISALGRERIFEHFSKACGTPVGIIRLNYSNEMRYGVLVDLAQKVFAGETIDVAMGNANVIWQGDACAMTLQAFDHVSSPPFIVNLAGPEMISIRRTAEVFGQLMGKEVEFSGTESPDALLSNGQLCHKLFGYPEVGVRRMMEWIADWVMKGGESLGKPTHFESRDGKF